MCEMSRGLTAALLALVVCALVGAGSLCWGQAQITLGGQDPVTIVDGDANDLSGTSGPPDGVVQFDKTVTVGVVAGDTVKYRTTGRLEETVTPNAYVSLRLTDFRVWLSAFHSAQDPPATIDISMQGKFLPPAEDLMPGIIPSIWARSHLEGNYRCRHAPYVVLHADIEGTGFTNFGPIVGWPNGQANGLLDPPGVQNANAAFPPYPSFGPLDAFQQLGGGPVNQLRGELEIELSAQFDEVELPDSFFVEASVDEIVVPVESETWGLIKSMFR